MTQEAAIRQLDGHGLVELAHRLGLAPDRVTAVWDVPTGEFRGCWYHNADGEPLAPWEPDTYLAPADAVVRALRARGWKTRVEGTARRGAVWADQEDTSDGIMVTWPSPHAACEAHALLLASVLAVASAQETTHEP